MSGYKLYSFFGSTSAWRAHIALNLKKITPQILPINMFSDGERGLLKKMNPNLNLPLLQLPDNTSLLQSISIIEYLNEVHPQPINLYPGDAKQRAQIRSFCEIINSGIQPYQNIKMVDKMRAGRFNVQWHRKFSDKKLQTLQRIIQYMGKSGKYVFGDTITAADILFYPQVLATQSRWSVNISHHPNVNRILNNLLQVKEFQLTNNYYKPKPEQEQIIGDGIGY